MPEGYLDEHAGKTICQIEEELGDSSTAWRVSLRRNDGQIPYEPGVILQKGDAAHVDMYGFYHAECLRLKVTVEERQKFDDCFQKAGFRHRLFTAIPNEYWGYPDCSKWFMVQTEFGDIKLGWRKRVVSIHCEDVDLDTITKDNVTMSEGVLHAWGYEKLTEYLTTIRNRLAELEAPS